MSGNLFLTADGLRGAAQNASTDNWVSLGGYSYEVNLDTGGTAEVESITLTFNTDAALAYFTGRNGAFVEDLFISQIVPGGETGEQVKIDQALVATINDTDEGFSTNLALTDLGKVVPQKDMNGGDLPSLTASVSGDEVSATINEDPASESVRPVEGDVSYYLAIDGIAGSATDPLVGGLHVIEDFDYTLTSSASGGGSGSGLTPIFTGSELSVSFDQLTGLAEMTEALTTGAAIPEVAIVGVAKDSDGKAVIAQELVFDTVKLTSLDTTGDGATAAFAFGDYASFTHVENAGTPIIEAAQVRMPGDSEPEGEVSADWSTSLPTLAANPDLTYFLEIENGRGDSSTKGLERAYVIDSLNLSLSAADGTGSGPDLNLALTLGSDQGANVLFDDVFKGEVVKARIVGLEDGDFEKRIVTYDLKDMAVTSVTDTADGGVDLSIGLTGNGGVTFGAFDLTTQAVNSNNLLEATGQTGWDFQANDEVAFDNGTIAGASDSTAADLPSSGLTYFVKLDGISGPETVDGAGGWIEVPEAGTLLSAKESGTRAALDPIGLTLAASPGVAALGDALVSGAVIDHVQVRGVDSAGRVVDATDLANVLISKLELGSAAPKVTLEFSQAVFNDIGTAPPDFTQTTKQGASGFDIVTNETLSNTPGVPSSGTSPGLATPDTYKLAFETAPGQPSFAGTSAGLDVESFDYTLGRDVSFSATGSSGPTVGAMDQTILNVTFADDTALTEFTAAAVTGARLSALELVGSAPIGTAGADVRTVRANDLTVTEVTDTEDEGFTVTFAVNAIGEEMIPVLASGALQPAVSFAHVPGATGVPDYDDLVSPAGTEGVKHATADATFVRFDGLPGEPGLTVDGEAGFYELEGFDLGAVAAALSGGGTASGPGSFDGLLLKSVSPELRAQLIDVMSEGGFFETVELRGTAGGTVVKHIDLSLVQIARVDTEQTPDDTDLKATLEFRQIVLRTLGFENGEQTDEAAFGWDVTRNQLVDPGRLALELVDTDTTPNVLAENTPIGTYADVDMAFGEGATFSLLDGPDGVFAITRDTGQIGVIGNIDFETLGPSVDVVVEARSEDGESKASKVITFTIEDVAGALIEGDDTDNLLDATGADDTLRGLGGNDTLRGNLQAQLIEGGGGADEIFAQAGDDVVDGGAGADLALLGNGNDLYTDDESTGADGKDTVEGGDGNDTIRGGAGDDSLLGQNGNDWLYGEDGNDFIAAASGQDLIFGGLGNDTVFGGFGADYAELGGGNDAYTDTDEGGEAGRDLVFGGAGRDTIKGGAGQDTIRGGGDGDELFGNNGGDSIFGDDGDDTIFAQLGNDTVDGGLGRDFVRLGQGADLYVDRAEPGGAGQDTVAGGAGKDTILGGGGNDSFIGGGGDDDISGGAGRDTLIGGAGNDTLRDADGGGFIAAGQGADLVEVSGGATTVLLGAGNDALDGGISSFALDAVGGVGNDTLETGVGNDTIGAGTGADFIRTDDGNDSIQAGAGRDTIFAGDGDDTVVGGNGDDDVRLGDGDDRFRDASASGDQGNDTVFAGDGNDKIFGKSGNDQFFGEDGEDEISGGAGSDIIDGGRDADMIFAGSGNDTVTDGDGSDRVFLGSGSDVFVSEEGGFESSDNDTITGGGGADSFLFTGQTGDDRITDFDVSQDRLLMAENLFLTGGSATTAAEVANNFTTYTGAGATITTDGGTLFVRNIRNASEMETVIEIIDPSPLF
ncbi:hypothetical protein [Pseudaestuariivita sp.]|uniref:hypothetical protein n=1 Tax=Pseudaestuariivita sp. TaxID=2211669 RepID=UPI004058CB09